MYCPKCGVETEQQIKFCKSCGLRLAEHALLLDKPEQSEKSKKLIWKGAEFMFLGWILLLFAFLVSSLPFALSGDHAIANDYSVITPFRRILGILLLMAIPTLIGGIGAVSLLRSGFFSNYRQRKIAEEMEELEKELEKKRQKLEVQSDLKLNSRPIAAERISIAENTTRELKVLVPDTGKIKGE